MQVLLSSQPRVTVRSRFVYKVIRDLESVDHLCINPIRISIHVSSSGVYKLMFSLTIVKKYYITVTHGWHDSNMHSSDMPGSCIKQGG